MTETSLNGGNLMQTAAEAPMDMDRYLLTGVFKPAEYEAAGSFTISNVGGMAQLNLSEDFASNPDAPDLYVLIGYSADPIAGKSLPFPLVDDEYKTIAKLQSVTGAQSYPIPAEIDLSKGGSVVIWCRRFNATMSYAPFEHQPEHGETMHLN